MKRELFEEEHNLFRESFRKFAEKEMVPHVERWEKAGLVDRELWLKAGEHGFLAMDVPEAYGGLGLQDFRYNMVINEEMARTGAKGAGFTLHNDIAVPYLIQYGTEEQKQRWLPRCISGEIITAIAMTEPDAGSDLNGIRTKAEDKGDHYLVNGSKTFITNGIHCDLVIVVCRTDPDKGHKGISLVVVEAGSQGFERGRKLEKMGQRAQDTSELFFNNVRVPKENLLGSEGRGFISLMEQLPQERLSIAVNAVAASETALDWTVEYCQKRTAFGRPIGNFQHNRFKLAEMKTEIQVARVFVDRCVQLLDRRELTVDEAAMAKWWTTELQKRVVDQCLQLHGGNGYMMEFPIARAYLDARVQTIYGGSTEIMKEIIGRSMGF